MAIVQPAPEVVRVERRRAGGRRRTDPERAMAADKSLPIWARMVGIVGPVGAIAFFLVYAGAQTLPALQAQLAVARQEIADLKLETVRLGSVIEQNQSRTEENHRLLVRICAAVTEGNERARCFDP